jgi:hypothetical protein
VKELRNQINKSASTVEVFQHLERFSWEAIELTKEVVFAESE